MRIPAGRRQPHNLRQPSQKESLRRAASSRDHRVHRAEDLQGPGGSTVVTTGRAEISDPANDYVHAGRAVGGGGGGDVMPTINGLTSALSSQGLAPHCNTTPNRR